MPIFIILITILSILVAFLSGTVSGDNAFFNYYLVLYNFFINNWIYFAIGFVIACVIFLRRAKLGNDYSMANKILISAFQVAGSVFAGTFCAYVGLLIIAWVELNGLAVVIDISPSLLGINSDVNSIISIIKANNFPPQIVASDTDNYEELLGVATATTGTTNVYGESILTSIPSLLVLPILEPPSSMMLIDNTLIVTKVKRSDLQKITPLIGNLLVQEYFPTRKIKAYPKAEVLSPTQYKKLRSGEYAAKLSEIDKQLTTISSDIASFSAGIQHDQDSIAADKAEINNANTQNTKAYSACVNAGYYQDNVYIKYNTKEYCQNQLTLLENQTQATTDDLTHWQTQLGFDQEQLASYQYYQKFFTTQKQLMSVTEVNIPAELGLFVPPSTIRVVITSSGTHIIANYFETVAHEYLHFASYTPGKAFTSTFFEEGLTEYFARQTIKDNFNVDTNLGYPVYVKIISEMTKIIPEAELADIYFTKDEARLEQTLDRVYGDGFYSKNLILFETLQYASDPQQILQLANNIMKQIGGTPLTIKDLESSEASL